MIGLSLDIAGAFLVAVEAIKLENLRLLRDGFIRKLEDYVKSPRIVFVEDGKPIAPAPPAVPADRYPGLFLGLHYLTGFALVLVVNTITNGKINRLFVKGLLWTFAKPWYVAVIIWIGFSFYGVVAGLWLLGELVHETLNRAVQLSIKLVDFIDARTPDGTVGILGFFLLLAGFLFQIYGAYKSGHGV